MKKLTSRQQQALDTRLHIIRTGLELFKEKDYDSVTIKDISEKAEVSVGAIYHHFVSKEDIINNVYFEFDNYLKDIYDQDDKKNCYERILEIISIQLEFVITNGLNVTKQVFKNQLANTYRYIIDKNRYFYQILKSTICDGINNNEINTSLSAEDIADLILRVSRGAIYDWCLHDGEYDLIECAARDLSFMLNNFR